MDNRRLTEDEVVDAVTTHFTTMGHDVKTKSDIQFGAGRGRMYGEADVVIKNPQGFWIAIVECKRERIGKGLEGEWQLKSYLSATDTRFGILAASSDPDNWAYFENLRSNVFQKRDRRYFIGHLSDDPGPRTERPDKDAINQLKTENEQLETDNEKLTSDNNQLETDNNQLNIDNEHLTSDNNQLETDNNQLNIDNEHLTSNNEQLETDNNQLKTDNSQMKTDNSQMKTDNSQMKTDNSQMKTDNSQMKTDNSQLKTDNNQLEQKMKNRTIVLSISPVLVIAACLCVYYFILLPMHTDTRYDVVRIIDGDTFEIQYKGKLTSVQLIGVNAPEPNTTNNRPPEPYSEEATKTLQEFLLDETVYFHYDQSKFDKYERILGYVYRASDGVFVNLQMIREGYAEVDRRYPFKYEELFTDYESRAKADHKGLWGGYR